MSIINTLNQIKNEEVLLPAIQRDFVWSIDLTLKLLDSIMRGYPIGMVLLWETYSDIQYRTFARNYRSGQVHTYRENKKGRRLRLVLDGQQRLQSLYLSLYGTREGKHLYFDLLSGQESDDTSDIRYIFDFLTSNEAKDHKKDARSRDEGEPATDYYYYYKVADIFSLGAQQRIEMIEGLANDLKLSGDEKALVTLNLGKFDDALSRDDNILKVSTIDENEPAESPYRKGEAEVLEIFVRINREGTPLTRSDLIFSMLKLNWKESAEVLPEFVERINEGNDFELDTDFVIRCLFAVSDLGTRLDLDLLRKKANVQKLRANFQQCCDAIRATVDFVTTECQCQSSRVLGGDSALVPFVYYLFHAPNHQVAEDQEDNVRKAVYLLGFARPFSRYAESRLTKFIRTELESLRGEDHYKFPLEATTSWVRQWERFETLDELLQRNHLLTLHLLQGRSGAKVQYDRNAPQIDHIFPRSVLRRMKRFDDGQINSFANFWILAAGKNLNKSNRRPAEYFKDVSSRVMKQAEIRKDLLDYRRYTTFLKTRRDAIVARLRSRDILPDEDLIRS